MRSSSWTDRQRVLAIQERNREVTRRNRGTSRSRIAAGWSSDREVLRWDTQLATNDTDVRAAQVLVLQNRFELNRVRNLPPEEGVSAQPATIDEYGFVYAREAIAEAVATPESDRRMRDFLTRVGLRRSPDLAALESSIAAAERQLTANRRAFWVPSLLLGAGIDRSWNDTSTENFDETVWGVNGTLTFPLFSGGAKFAGLEQANEVLASLRTQRRRDLAVARADDPIRLRAGERIVRERRLHGAAGRGGPPQLRARRRLLHAGRRLDPRPARRANAAAHRGARARRTPPTASSKT